MSEQGADKAKLLIAKGFRFFLKTMAICGGLALIFWRLPDLANFIITLKNS